MMTDLQFNKIAKFFEKLKVLHGPEFVNATLNRHRKLYSALLEYEKCAIQDIESKLFAEE